MFNHILKNQYDSIFFETKRFFKNTLNRQKINMILIFILKQKYFK